MIRDFKTLGVTLVAVFALSATAASAASAQNGVLTSDGPVTLVGTQTPAENPTLNNRFTEFGGTTSCPNATYTGHEVLTEEETELGFEHEPIEPPVSEITITPHYGSCTTLGVPATIDMNGCDYEFDLEGTTGNPDEYFVKTTVNCPEGRHVTKTLFTTATKHTENKPFCHITYTENAAGYAGLKATDTTNGHIDINGTVEGITADKKSPTGSILCPEETTNSSAIDTDLTFEGLNELGEPTDIGLSHS